MVSLFSGPMESDRELVLRYVGGDHNALGEIYARYCDRVHDLCMAMLHSPDDAADAFQDTFLVAASHLDGLRKPERLRPWLYSVARNQCRARLRARKRTRPEEDAGVDIGIDVDMTSRVASAEVTQLVVDAQAGLNERDQEVLDLHMRHGLEGEDLAEVLGVSLQSAYKLVQRVRGRVEKSLGSLLVARHGRRDCPALDQVLARWDGRFSPLIRKRVSRHISDCDICTRRRRALLDPSGLASASPFTPVPEVIRGVVLDSLMAGTAAAPAHEPEWRGDGFPAAAGARGRRLPRLAFAGIIGVLILVGGVIGSVGASFIGGRNTAAPPTVTTAIPVTTTAAPVTTTTTPTTTTAPPTTTSAPIAVTTTAPVTTTTTPPTTTSAPIAVTTAAPPTVTTTAPVTTTTAAPTTTKPDTTAPVFAANSPSTDAGTIWEDYPKAQCGVGITASPAPLITADLTAHVSDNVGISAVQASWTINRILTTTNFSFSSGDRLWHGVFGPFPSGTVTSPNGEVVVITVTASDAAGNSAQQQVAPGQGILLLPCP